MSDPTREELRQAAERVIGFFAKFRGIIDDAPNQEEERDNAPQ